MPQLDPRFFVSQFFWMVVCFAIFYVCVHFIIVPRLRSIFSTRDHVNEKNSTTAHMLSLRAAELRSDIHNKTVHMQRHIDEMKSKYDNKFQEYSQNLLTDFNEKVKKSHEEVMMEIEQHKKVLLEKSTSKYVEDLANKVISKLTGVKV